MDRTLIGGVAALVATGKNGELLLDVLAIAVNAFGGRIITRNDLFEVPFAIFTDIFENRHKRFYLT